MANPPLTPLGKQLSDSPIVSNAAPLASGFSGLPAAPEQPVSAFQWVSLVRATWTWILRPLWQLCVIFPFKIGSAMGAQSNDALTRTRDNDESDRYNYHR